MASTEPAAPGTSDDSGDASLGVIQDTERLGSDLRNGMLLNEATADVILKVHGERLPAHRALLASRSRVFFAMFFGTMLESSSKEVELSTFSATIMKQLLRYLYTGRIDNLSWEDAIALNACADHYDVRTLKEAIEQRTVEVLRPENACKIFLLAQECQHEELKARSLQVLRRYARTSIRTDEFLCMNYDAIVSLVEADDVGATEVDLFKALVRWHRKQPGVAERDGEAQSHGADISAMSDGETTRLFAKIRYGLFTADQLVMEVSRFVGRLVPPSLYVRALEHAAAPGSVSFDDHKQTVSRRGSPAVKVSDTMLLVVDRNTVRRIGRAGYACSAIVDLGESTVSIVPKRMKAPDVFKLGIYSPTPQREYPNADNFGCECLIALGARHGYSMRLNRTVEVAVTPSGRHADMQRVSFVLASDSDHTASEPVLEQEIPASPNLKLAVALYNPGDEIEITYATPAGTAKRRRLIYKQFVPGA